MARTDSARLTDRGPLVPHMMTLPSKANSLYPKNTIVTRDENGRAVSPSSADSSGYPAMGISKATFDNRTNSEMGGANDSGFIEIDCGIFAFDLSGSTPLPGDELFVVDNQTLSGDSNGGLRGTAGKCTEVRTDVVGTTQVYCQMGPTAVHRVGGQGEIVIPLNSFHLSTGAPMAVFADAASPTFGLTVVGSESLAIRWNNDAAPGTAFCEVSLPRDLDETRDMVLEFLVSKSGATLADATTLTLTAFMVASGDLYDADADAGGVTGAVTGNAAAKTTALLTRTIAAADIPSGARVLTFSVKPTAGTLGTDDFFLHEARLRYVRK